MSDGSRQTDINSIREYYSAKFLKFGTSSRTLGYASDHIDDCLIKNLLPEIKDDSFTVLDIGCGFGQLIPLLRHYYPEKSVTAYQGIDIVPEFITSCSAKFPAYQFDIVDFLAWQPTRKFDLVIAAGVLVSKVTNYPRYLSDFIGQMIACSDGWVSFNVITELSESYSSHVAQITLPQLEEILEGFPNIKWSFETAEAFPGSRDTFVIGTKLGG